MSNPDPRYDSYFEEYELGEWDDVDPVQMTFCSHRPIWPFHLKRMQNGGRGICRVCRAIHVWENGAVVMKGFKA